MSGRMLYAFDVDGTLIRSFLREGAPRTAENYDAVELLPGRREKLADLLEAGGSEFALVTNQGGVAMGYQDEAQVERKMARVLEALSLGMPFRICSSPPLDTTSPPPTVYVAYGHPKAKIDRYRVESKWRKPGGWMLVQAILDYNLPESKVTFVGDMDSDRLAAENAGVPYIDAAVFFA